MSPRLRSFDGGKMPKPLAEIQAGIARNLQFLRDNPEFKADLDRRSAQSHAAIRQAEEGMKRPAKGAKTNKNTFREDDVR